MKRRRWIVVALLLASLAAVGIRLLGSEGDSKSSPSYVSFNTADVGPDWSPDGRLIAFATNRGSGGIYLVRPNGSAMRSLFRGEASDVDWSPDGKAIAFTGRGGIYLVRLRDGRTSVVLRGKAFSLPAWAPNGRELAVVKDEPGVFPGPNGPIKTTSPAIYLVRTDGSHLRRMLPRYERAVGDARPGSVAAVSESGPAWAPDGKRIAFEASDDRLVVAEAESGRRILTIRWAGGAAWSPDGRRIAYGCAGGVCVANADGSGPKRRIASGGGSPSWSPDGRLLVFERYLYGGSYFAEPRSLSIVGANGDGLRTLTYGPSSS